MKYRYLVLGLLVGLSILTYVDRTCISVAGKTMQEELHLNPTQWGWVLGCFILAYSLFELPTGALGDRIGPRRVLARVVLWWSAFTALTAAAAGLGQLLTVRFLFGAGEAGAYPNISSALARWFPNDERARAQAVIWMASRLGGALSPLLVIPVLRACGWRLTFVVFGAVGVIWAAIWFKWFKDDPAEVKAVSPEEIAELKLSATKAEPHRLPWGQILGRPNLWWMLLMYLAHGWGAFFFTTWLFTFLENGRGYTKSDILHLAWLPFVCGAGANLLGGFTSDYLVRKIGLKWGRRSVALTGQGLSALFMAAAVLAQGKVTTLGLLSLAYAGSDFTLPVAWAVCLDIGGKNTGAVSGAMNTAGNFGGFLSTVVFGSLVTSYGSYNLPLIVTAVISVISTLSWLRIDPCEPITASPPQLPTLALPLANFET